MKRIILLTAVLLCLTSCGKQSEQTASKNAAETELTKAVTSQVITEIIDTSTNESGDDMENYDFSTLTNVELINADIGSMNDEQLAVLYAQARYCQTMTDADIDTMRELVSEDMTYTHMSGMTQTREEYFADIADGSLRYFTIGMDSPKVEVSGDTASVTYTSVLNANAYGARGTYRMKGTHYYEKRDCEWIAVNAPKKGAMRKRIKQIPTVIAMMILGGCGQSGTSITESKITSETTQKASETTAYTTEQDPEEQIEQTAPTLLYMGQASIRIVTGQGKVIYIDPYAGDAYDLPADLILVTHDHNDHSDVDKVSNRSPDCEIITHKEAVVNGEHKTFELGYVTVEAVEAGFNDWHDVNDCAGYVLTFENGSLVYVTGDTSKTDQMSEMSSMNIDYAFYCCDVEFNMGLDEAAECARLVGAKHNIPYHNTTDNSGDHFDREKAQQFDAPNRLIIEPGEEIELVHEG